MANASLTTTLRIQQVEAEVGLYKATSDPRAVTKFDTAGPNGGKLKYEQRAAAAPTDDGEPEPETKGDPLGADERKETAAKAEATFADDGPALVDGAFTQVLVEEGTGEAVMPDMVRRGLRLDDGRFIDCTDQLAAIDERTKLDEMRILAFIDIGAVPRHRVCASYFLGTNDPQAMPVLRLLYEGMRGARRAAVVRWTARSRQTLGVIVPFRTADGVITLLALKLAWAEDWRPVPSQASLGGVAVSEAMSEQALSLVQAMSDKPQALDELRDEAIALREELRARAKSGEIAKVVEPVQAPEPGEDVADALERSLAAVSDG